MILPYENQVGTIKRYYSSYSSSSSSSSSHSGSSTLWLLLIIPVILVTLVYYMIKGCLSRGRKIAEIIPNSSPTQIGTCHIVQRHKSDSPPPAYNMSEIPLQPAPAYLPLYEQISSQQLQSTDELDRLNASPTP